MDLIDGNAVAEKTIAALKEEIASLKSAPSLTLVRVGNDHSSGIYVNRKRKVAQSIGIKSTVLELPAEISQGELLDKITQLNHDTNVHGILVQSPLSKHHDALQIFNAIDPNKDVDGFHCSNVGKLCQEDDEGFVPCTPLGILELLKHYKVDTQGKHVVVLGRSLIVGKPAALLMTQNQTTGNATVTLCHSKTKDLEKITQTADILIAAIGKAQFVKESMVKEGAVVIDVGINRIEDSSKKKGYRISGDVDFDKVAPKSRYITPVPGGVGPMTVAMLMKNTLKAYEKQNLHNN